MSFPAKTPDEIKLVTFDFSTEAATGSILSTPVVAASEVVSGTGAVGDITVTSAAVDGLTVTALVGGGIDGTKYRISCTVDADNGEVHQIDKDLPVKDSAAVVR